MGAELLSEVYEVRVMNRVHDPACPHVSCSQFTSKIVAAYGDSTVPENSNVAERLFAVVIVFRDITVRQVRPSHVLDASG